MTPESVSIRPSEMIAGGAVPVDKNMEVKEARFVVFDYQGKGNPTTALRLLLIDDDGVEFTQHFSAADPKRFQPSQDGKSVVSLGSAEQLSNSSNFYVLMNNLVSSGFPENRLEQDISILEKLYAYWIGVPEPKRPGLVRTPEQLARGERVIPVPSQILRLPWEKKAAAKPSGKPATGKAQVKTASVAVAEEGEGEVVDVSARAVALVGTMVDESGSVTRQDVAVRVFADLADDPNRDDIATFIFSPGMQAALLGAGYKVKGETISK